MSRHRIPKGPVRRTVWLNRKVLFFALSSMRDDRDKVIASMAGPDGTQWAENYEQAERHLLELIGATERS